MYLAQLQRKPFKRIELILTALQDKRGYWIKLPQLRVIDVNPELTALPDESLVLVQFDKRKEVTKIIDAFGILPIILSNLSTRLAALEKKEPEFKEWHESLTYQSKELNIRAEKLELREQEVQVRETFLTVENAKLEKQRTALGEAWSQVRLEQKRLEENS